MAEASGVKSISIMWFGISQAREFGRVCGRRQGHLGQRRQNLQSLGPEKHAVSNNDHPYRLSHQQVGGVVDFVDGLINPRAWN